MPQAKYPFLKSSKEGVLLSILVSPGSKRNRIIGIHGDQLKIAISAPATNGRANQGLIEFMANLLGTSKSSIKLVKGLSSKHKLLMIKSKPESVIIESLGLNGPI